MQQQRVKSSGGKFTETVTRAIKSSIAVKHGLVPSTIGVKSLTNLRRSSGNVLAK